MPKPKKNPTFVERVKLLIVGVKAARPVIHDIAIIVTIVGGCITGYLSFRTSEQHRQWIWENTARLDSIQHPTTNPKAK